MGIDGPSLAAIAVRLMIFVASLLGVAFFSGTETAFLAMDRWAVEGLRQTGDRRAVVLSSLSADAGGTISSLLVGINVFTVLASTMGASIAHMAGSGRAIALALVPAAVTCLLFFFSELVPKSYASENPTEIALATAPVLGRVLAVFRPISILLSALPTLLMKAISRRASEGGRVTNSDEPIRLAVNMASAEGHVETEDGEVIMGVLDSSDTKVADIMVPIQHVVSLTPEQGLSDALGVFRKHLFSRIPVISPGTGEALGVAYMKDLMKEMALSPDSNKPVSGLMRPAFSVSPAENVLDVLSRMKRNRVHLAVVSEGRKAAGIVTIEDILEEIVGDIPEDARPGGMHSRI